MNGFIPPEGGNAESILRDVTNRKEVTNAAENKKPSTRSVSAKKVFLCLNCGTPHILSAPVGTGDSVALLCCACDVWWVISRPSDLNNKG